MSERITEPRFGMASPPSDAAGFTIIETMLTLATVFISALVLATANVAVHGQGRLNRDRSLAMEEVEALTEQMAASPIGAISVLFPHDQEIAAFNDRSVQGLRLKLSYVNGDTAARPLRYAVQATWTGSQGRPAKLVIHGLRMR